MRESLKEALNASPDNIPLLVLYAHACEEELEFAEMQETWERVLQLDPGHEQARCGLIQALYLSGKVSEASVRMQAWLSGEPRYAAAWLLAARIALAEEQKHEARSYYERALDLDGNCRNEGLEKDIFPQGRPEAKPSEPETERRMTSFGPVSIRQDEEEEGESSFSELERPQQSFADVGGMEALKEEIRMKVLYPLENPQLFEAYGKKVGGGVLLYGPPGCGKTLISRATAGEIDANFISVSLHEVLDMWIGSSEKQLHALFEMARQHKPAVLFIDEVDALAADRRDMRQSGGRTLINQFLAEMDSSNDANDGVLILGATNSPWHIDPAFRRPGRFDRVLFVPPPDLEARKAILEIMVQDKPVEKLDLKSLAKLCKDFSGADMKALLDVATEAALSEAMKSGRVVPITGKQLLKAAKQVKPSTSDWFASAKNYAMYANQSGLYDSVLEYMGIKG